MPSAIVTPDMAKGPDAPKIIPFWFLTDGTTDPSKFINLLDSVERLTDNATSTPFYRLHFTLSEDFDTIKNDGQVSLQGFQGGVIVNDPTLQLSVRLAKGLAPTGDARLAGFEIDVVVSQHSEAALLAQVATASAAAIAAATANDGGVDAFTEFATSFATYAATVGATTGATNSVAAGQYITGWILLNIGFAP